jgi:hypothetical protein
LIGLAVPQLSDANSSGTGGSTAESNLDDAPFNGSLELPFCRRSYAASNAFPEKLPLQFINVRASHAIPSSPMARPSNAAAYLLVQERL